MGLSSLYPTVKPSLSLDFANAKTLDPRITFTRATTGTYYDGTTVKAEENLLLRSQDYSATWTVSNLTPVTGKTAPGGTSTATEFTAGAANGTLTQSVTAIAADYTFSVWLRRVTGTGNVDITAHSGGTWVTQTITSTWARYTVTQTLTAGTRTPGVRVVTSGDVVEVWGAQLEQRSAATAYTPTTTATVTSYIPRLVTASAGVARFDHNPTTGESLGLLVEEQRANLLLRSEEIDNAAWTKSRLSITPNATVAPDGTVTADQLVEDTQSGTHRAYQSVTKASSAIQYTASFYLKSAGRSFAQIRVSDTAEANVAGVAIDLTSGTVGSTYTAGGASPFTSLSATSTNAGNGWHRLAFTFTTNTDIAVIVFATVATSLSNTTPSYTGDGYSGIYAWGAQLEAGAFATSYIYTTTAQVTRSADSASMTGTNFSTWYRADEGTLVLRARPYALPAASGNARLVCIDDGTINNRSVFMLGANSGNTQMTSRTSGSDQASINVASSFVVNQTVAAAGAYKADSFGFSVNGSTTGTDTSGTVPSTVTQLVIGSSAGATERPNGTIERLAYYPFRLANHQIQALTT